MKIKLIIALSFLISINFISAQNNNCWLKKNVNNVESIDPKNENFDDLKFLIPLLKDKQIVMLGEESHSFATTFEAKSRLVKFLHQELGFNVLAFEFNLYTMWDIDNLKTDTTDNFLPIQNRIYQFWGGTTSTQELFKYVESSKKSESPINYIGFDCQIIPSVNIVDKIKRMLKESNSEILDYKNFDLFIKTFQKNYNERMKNVLLEDYVLISLFIDDILFEYTQKKDKDKETLVILRTLENVKIEIYHQMVNKPTQDYQMGNLNPTDSIYGFLGDRRSLGLYNRRDKLMAENIKWIKEKLYPNSKIIIWAHSEHIMYERNKVKKVFPPDFPFHLRYTYGYNYINMGDYLKSYYNKSIYSIGFSALSGKVDYSTNKNVQYFSNIEIEEKSIEKELIGTNFKYPFLDFSNRKEKLPKNIFNEYMNSNFLDGKKTIGYLPDFFDGILFLRNVKPIEYIKEDND